jgi:methionine-rich copper-binding protein CopC
MTHRTRTGRFRVAGLLAFALLALLPASAMGHAELSEASPGDGDVVGEPLTRLTADFTEDLADGSAMTLRDAAGAVVAEGGIHPSNERLMLILVDEPLPSGEYEVGWQALAADGHIERGTYRFTVATTAAATPTAAPSQPAASAGASAPPSGPAPTPIPATPAPSAAPTDPAASSGEVLLPILAAVVLVGLLGGYLLFRRRPASRP